jgi:hypothetical protein
MVSAPPNLNEKPVSPYSSIYSIFHLILSLFAFYLSVKCNNGINYGSLLAALLCPHFYIIYVFATSNDFCGLRSA